jgi:group I intron endonuclease
METALPTCSGIYIITSTSGKFYVGSAVNLYKRWALHRTHLKKGEHHCKPLQHAYQKYGLEGLAFKVLFICKKEDLLWYEQRTIDTLHPQYNTCLVAGSRLGQKNTESHNLSIGNGHRGRKYGEEARMNMRLAHLGKKHGPMKEETKKKLSLSRQGNTARLGKKNSEFHNQRISEYSSKPVRCIETGEVFKNAIVALMKIKQTDTRLNASNIALVCKGKRPKAYGYSWEFVGK